MKKLSKYCSYILLIAILLSVFSIGRLAPEVLAAVGDNLFKNPDFSEGVTPWVLDSGGAIPASRIAAGEGLDGSNALYLNNALANEYLNYPVSQLTEPLKANTTYELIIRYKGTAASEAIGIHIPASFGINGVVSGGFSFYTVRVNGWATMTYIFTTPASVPTTGNLIRISGGGTEQRYIDNISLKETNKAETGSFAVKPSVAEVSIGHTKTIELFNTLTSTPWDDSVLNKKLTGKEILWTSSNKSVAVVNNSGVVTGIDGGTATIMATIKGSTGNADVILTSEIRVLDGAAYSPNLLKNPDFSEGVTPWVLDSGSAIPASRIAAGEGVNGSSAIRLHNDLGNVFLGYPISELKTTLKPNTTYKLSYRYKASNEFEAVGVHFEKAFGVNNVSTSGSFGLYGAFCNGWATQTHTFTMPATIPATGSLFRFSGGGSTNRYIDSVSLREIPKTETLSVGIKPSVALLSIGNGKTIELINTLTTTSWDSSVLNRALTGKTVTWSSSDTAVAAVNSSGIVTGLDSGTATITATIKGSSGNADIVLPMEITVVSDGTVYGDNLLKNHNFSEGVTPWALDNGNAIPSTRIASGEGVNGTNAIRLHNDLGNVFLGYPVSELKTALKPNTTYELSYRYKASDETEAVGVHFEKAFGVNNVSTGGSFGLYSAFYEGWATQTYIFTTPAAVPTTGRLFRFSGGGSTNRYIDSVVLRERDRADTVSLAVRPSVLEMDAGGRQEIELINTFTSTTWDSTVLNRPLTGKTVVWSSSNKNVATVDVNGTVTAVGKGTATIRAAIAGSGITVASVVYVDMFELVEDTLLKKNTGNDDMDGVNILKLLNMKAQLKEQTKPPAQSAAAGFTRIAFYDDFTTSATIDKNATGAPGYKWYLDRPDPGDRDLLSSEVEVKNGKLILKPADRGDWGISTWSARGKTGFKYQYGYAEIRFRHDYEYPDGYTHTTGRTNGWPCIWLWRTNTSPAGQDQRLVELDIYEAYNKGGKFSAHDSLAHAGGGWSYLTMKWDYFFMQNSKYHLLGLLWEEGKVTWYVDNLKTCMFEYSGSKIVKATTFNTTASFGGPYFGNPTPVASGTTTMNTMGSYTMLEQQTMQLILGAHADWPLEVDWVKVWQ